MIVDGSILQINGIMCSSSPFILQFLNDKAFEHIVYHRKEKNTKMQAKGQQKRKMILPFAFQ